MAKGDKGKKPDSFSSGFSDEQKVTLGEAFLEVMSIARKASVCLSGYGDQVHAVERTIILFEGLTAEVSKIRSLLERFEIDAGAAVQKTTSPPTPSAEASRSDSLRTSPPIRPGQEPKFGDIK